MRKNIYKWKEEIYIVNFPITGSHEQEGVRPSVIIIDFPELPIVQIMPLTSSKKALKYQHTVIIAPDKENNLKKESIVLLFQLRAIDKNRLERKVGKLSRKDIERVKEALKQMFDFS